MSVERDEFDRLVARVDSLERQTRAIIGLLSDQVMAIVPAIERGVAELGESVGKLSESLGESIGELGESIGELGESIGELSVYTHDEFGKVDHKLDDIIRRLP